MKKADISKLKKWLRQINSFRDESELKINFNLTQAEIKKLKELGIDNFLPLEITSKHKLWLLLDKLELAIYWMIYDLTNDMFIDREKSRGDFDLTNSDKKSK
ncbi:MAG: hypothetical protein CEN89_169 [Candidatus Berkelbacteria bacterium Licking1014_7]|uniref:Uncharacterized protein n=1 Tax=Candidatus Berkelbacteria bacterium Licking1014_7 TaxID=2017147 RepID=A0A554LK50_9BACT|nr:MAG: hypothetical protein CEN89_169 [Candidatus Berkelbacteria bacterium Licking1014_7]